MTIELCRDMAIARGLRYYGLQWTSDCYATNNHTSPVMHKTGRPCNMPCAGNVTQRCGGDQANDVYDVTLGELVSC
jgi:glucan endo-1,3-alpha-glucosidase